ncbi:hypothetical protein MRB53_038303 [Persea americana]|nr:hypothetical protein MRB53_038303 [Persea americana]
MAELHCRPSHDIAKTAKSINGNVRCLMHCVRVLIRAVIRSAILSGDVDSAIALTNEHYPSVLRDNEEVHFRLRCRKFVEIVIAGSNPRRHQKSRLRLLSGNGHGNGHGHSHAHANASTESLMDVDGSPDDADADAMDTGDGSATNNI